MFEPGQGEEKSSSSGMWIGIGVVVLLAVIGGVVYMNSGSSSTSSTSPSATSSSGASTAAPEDSGAVKGRDPVKDLRVVSATVAKTPAGAAEWTVDIKNQSDTGTYSNFNYATAYMGADNSSLRQGQGKVPVSLGPGDEQTVQVQDGAYPPKTAWYKFNIAYDMSQ